MSDCGPRCPCGGYSIYGPGRDWWVDDEIHEMWKEEKEEGDKLVAQAVQAVVAGEYRVKTPYETFLFKSDGERWHAQADPRCSPLNSRF